jgi:hypothetical protein
MNSTNNNKAPAIEKKNKADKDSCINSVLRSERCKGNRIRSSHTILKLHKADIQYRPHELYHTNRKGHMSDAIMR